MKKETTPAVDAIASLHIEGNVIPQQWFQRIRLNGRPDTIAVIILGEVFYWYRPTIVRDEATGEVKELRRKFDADKWQCSYQSLADRFGFTKRQAQDAAKRLRDAGLITLELRNFKSKSGTWLSNVLFIEPIPDAIRAITFEDTPSYATTEEVLRQNVTPPTPERMTYTETPTETPTEIPTERGSGAKDAPPPAADQHEPEGKRKRKERKPRKEPENVPPSVKVFQSVRHFCPAKETWAEIDGVVGIAPDDLDRWRQTLIGYALAGFNRTALDGPLDWFRLGITARPRNGNGKRSGPDLVPIKEAGAVPRVLTRADFGEGRWNSLPSATQAMIEQGHLYDDGINR